MLILILGQHPRKYRTTYVTMFNLTRNSPYVGNYVDVYFRGGGTPCKVPKVLLKEYSKLHGLCNGWDGTHSLHLNEISWDVRHSVVHFLYTRTYQILQPIGTTALERDIAEFTTHILVYVAAREYGLLGLEESARGGIEKLGENLEMPTIIKAAKHAYPNPNTDDEWFIEYLKSRSRALLTNQTTIDFRTTTTGTMSVVEIVLQGLVQSLGASHDPLETSGPIIAEGAENASDFDTSLTKCVFTPSADSGDIESLRTSTDGKPEETLPPAELLVSTPGPTTEALGGEGCLQDFGGGYGKSINHGPYNRG